MGKADGDGLTLPEHVRAKIKWLCHLNMVWTMERSNLSKIISGPDQVGCLEKQTNAT